MLFIVKQMKWIYSPKIYINVAKITSQEPVNLIFIFDKLIYNRYNTIVLLYHHSLSPVAFWNT